MGQISRCPLVGIPCDRPINIKDDTFFLAEVEKPEEDKQRRRTAIRSALGAKYKIRSALDEKGINAFTCKICEMIQESAYGIADITKNNPNVLFELGIMIALGKPTIILVKKSQELRLKLPSDLNAIEVVPFTEYIDIIDQLKEIIKKLPPPEPTSIPIQDLEKLKPQIAEEVKKIASETVEEFKKSIKEAKLDTPLSKGEKVEIPPALNEKLSSLEEKIDDLQGLGIITDADTSFFIGNYLIIQGKFKEALAAYNRTLILEPNNSDALCNRSIANRILKKYDDAMADCNLALKLNPNDPFALSKRGGVYIVLGKYEDALNDLKRAYKLDPNTPGILYDISCVYSRQGKLDDALSYLKRAIKKDELSKRFAILDIEKDFDNIRNDPRFKKLISG